MGERRHHHSGLWACSHHAFSGECGLQVGGRPQGLFPGSLKRPLLLLYLILRSFLNQNIFDILAPYLRIVGIECAGPLFSTCTCAPAPRRRFLWWRLPGEAELEGGHVVQADSGLHNWCPSNFPKQTEWAWTGLAGVDHSCNNCGGISNLPMDSSNRYLIDCPQ